MSTYDLTILMWMVFIREVNETVLLLARRTVPPRRLNNNPLTPSQHGRAREAHALEARCKNGYK